MGAFDVRRAGVLIHVTSLPNVYGAGDLGPSAYGFVDFLEAAGCSVWQVLPLVPTHAEDRSPYNAISAMAGNPDLISVELLARDGLVTDVELADLLGEVVIRDELRWRAAERFLARPTAEFTRWCVDNAGWLETFVQFVALRESLGQAPWTQWEIGLRDRDAEALSGALHGLGPRMEVLRFEQWVFATQWAALHEYARERGVLLFGDLPIFVSLDSADVWAHRDLFQLDTHGQPTTVTGVPPDYFSADGQRWNNPHYDWDRMAGDDFAWWRARIARQRELFDLVRIDHFRGFEAAWHVPADAETAKDGEWVRNPGREVLAALVGTSGEGTLVAEDLGTITEKVKALREEFGLPGMLVMQFAFDGSEGNPYVLEKHRELDVVYTGTHDNDTTLGWWESIENDERKRVMAVVGDDLPWGLIRLAFESRARLAVVPAQDLLELGREARMNTPGTAADNWSWQALAGAFNPRVATRLRTLVEQTDRLVS